MSPRPMTTFRIDEELLEGLRAYQQQEGVPISEQVRRAIRMWLELKGVMAKAERKRAATRKRS